MALTTGGSVNPNSSGAANSAAAEYVSPAGVTRVGRRGRVAQEAFDPDNGARSYGDAFIDGSSLPRLDSDSRPDVRQTAQISGEGTGFPGIADHTGDTQDSYYPDSGGNTAAARGAAPVVQRGATVRGGQPSGNVAANTSENYSHGSSAGFPFEVPAPRKL